MSLNSVVKKPGVLLAPGQNIEETEQIANQTPIGLCLLPRLFLFDTNTGSSGGHLMLLRVFSVSQR
jgi:hypothetical protein